MQRDGEKQRIEFDHCHQVLGALFQRMKERRQGMMQENTERMATVTWLDLKVLNY